MAILDALMRVPILDYKNLENIHCQIWSAQVQNHHPQFQECTPECGCHMPRQCRTGDLVSHNTGG